MPLDRELWIRELANLQTDTDKIQLIKEGETVENNSFLLLLYVMTLQRENCMIYKVITFFSRFCEYSLRRNKYYEV